jgi:adenine/guanine phosphoribosyltransferase-like PRPP-binding protein
MAKTTYDLPPNGRSAAIRYAQLRMERLIKLARASVRVRLAGDGAVADSAHRWILRYGRFLIQLFLGRTDFANEEHLLLLRLLQEVPLWDPELRRRALALFSHWEEDRHGSGAGAALYKVGASSLSKERLDRYVDWMRRTLPQPDGVVAILSRGLPDALLTGEILEVPVYAVCVSRRRLGLTEALPIDLPDRPGTRALVVDAHRKTGETLAQCWRFLETRGTRVLGTVITQDEGDEETLPPSWVRLRTGEGWSLSTPTARK